eukprot:2972261-Prymnesium_polylepis.2
MSLSGTSGMYSLGDDKMKKVELSEQPASEGLSEQPPSNELSQQSASKDDLADLVHIFDGEFTCEDDKHDLVPVVLGLWSLMLQSHEMHREATQNTSADTAEIEPSIGARSFSTLQGKLDSTAKLVELIQESKASVFPSALFGDSVNRLEQRLESHKHELGKEDNNPATKRRPTWMNRWTHAADLLDVIHTWLAEVDVEADDIRSSSACRSSSSERLRRSSRGGSRKRLGAFGSLLGQHSTARLSTPHPPEQRVSECSRDSSFAAAV